MQITKIIAIGEGKNPENILLTVLTQKDGSVRKRKFEVTQEDYERLNFPSVDSELSEYEYRILTRSLHQKDATSVALRILSQGDNNCISLKRKLTERGFSPDTAEATLARMVELGYIDERKQTYRYVLKLANQNLYGKRKIIPFLLNKGYKKEDIEEAIEKALQSGEVDFSEIKKRLIGKSRFNEGERAEINALLYKYGHNESMDF